MKTARLLAALRPFAHRTERRVEGPPPSPTELFRYYAQNLLAEADFRMERIVGTGFALPRSYPFFSFALHKASGGSTLLDRFFNRLTRNARAVNLVLRCTPSSRGP